jgi:hypothetical protein
MRIPITHRLWYDFIYNSKRASQHAFHSSVAQWQSIRLLTVKSKIYKCRAVRRLQCMSLRK